jgi:abortive infection bacteriophage resistance protein
MSSVPQSPHATVPFTKKWDDCATQVAILQSRGLVVRDTAAAIEFLTHINYYRFSGFCVAFESSRHVFAPGSMFEDVRAAYDFDQRLRDLLNEALEVVEIDLRTAIAAPFGQHYGPFGHTDSRNFHGSFLHKNWLHRLRQNTKESNELFVKHFRLTYSQFPDLPIWMLTEILSFGSLSKMFKGMLRPDQRRVAGRYGMQAHYLISWVHHLVYVRNICAHHARLWDRRWAIKPELPPSRAWTAPSTPLNDTVFVTLLILNQLMAKCPCLNAFRSNWKTRLEQQVASVPPCANSLERLGMTTTWTSHDLWQ